MRGMSRHSGRVIDGDAHLAQSIVDILSTPRGTRVMRRDYGSDLPFLIDRPITGETLVDVYMATAEALHRWEPRLSLRRVTVEEASPGAATLAMAVDIAGEARTLTAEIAVAA